MKHSKLIPVTDYLEDFIDDAIEDEDWETSEFYQDILAVCLQYNDKMARNALKMLGCVVTDSKGCHCLKD